MKKKFCLALFVTILMMSLLFGVALAAEESSVSADTSWYSSEEILYIEDEADLLGLALIVNGESEDVPRTDFADQTVVLVNDLDLGQMDWTPIGKANVTINNGTALFQEAASMPFRGVFDGNQRKIENLNIEGSNNGMALFGYLGSGGVIKNLTVSGAVSGTYFTGGVVSVCGGTLEEVENQVVVYGEENYVGGLAAEGYGTFSIVGCTNRGAVSNGSSSRSSGFVAGIMGRADSDAAGVIKECANLATITGYQYVAGIIGGQFGDVDVDACYNSAEINGISFGKAYLGGIAGKSEGGTIRNCYNRGDLYDHHWSAGHIRAVGGIAGCEEGRADGTLAISNCYTTGKIELNTSNMTYGTNWIYEVGNISGGNSTTADNMMRYENCYYLQGRIALADPRNDSYQLWADVYKNNPLIWDTEYIEGKTEDDMKSASFVSELGGAFSFDSDNVNDGFPILYWQAGEEQPQEIYQIEVKTVGSQSAKILLSQTSAAGGTAITAELSGVESDKAIKSFTVQDTAGRDISVTKSGERYFFTMPERNVVVTATFENKVDENAQSYRLELPEGLDAIWSVDAESTYLENGEVKAGATVHVTVQKETGAVMTSLKGLLARSSEEVTVSVLDERSDNTGAGYYGEYAFTMPEADVKLELDIEYEAFEVYTQSGLEGEPQLVKSFSRDEMEALAREDLYYSGYASDTEVFIGKAAQGITLKDLLFAADLSLGENDVLEISGADGMNLYYTYDFLYGSERCYYPNLISGTNETEKADGKTVVDAMFVLKGNMAEGASENIEEKIPDTLNAYRFVFGQTEAEFNGGVPNLDAKAVDKMPKCCNRLILITDVDSSVREDAVSFIDGADYNATISGYKVLKLEAEKLNELKYQYQGVDLLWSEKYECYLTMVPSDVTAGAAAVALELVDGTAPEIVYDGDINGDSHLLIDDVQLVYDLYTVYEAYSHDSGYDLVSVVGRLKADYNGDGVVDVLDVRLIQKSLLGYSE